MGCPEPGTDDEARTLPVTGPLIDLSDSAAAGAAARTLALRAGAGGRTRALLGLARTALRGAEHRALFDAAADLIHVTLEAEASAVLEYLAGDDVLLVRAASGWPPFQSIGEDDLAEGTKVTGPPARMVGPRVVITPIPGDLPYLFLAVRAATPGGGFSFEDHRFVLDVAEILGEALDRLGDTARQRDAALHDPLTGLPSRALILDHLRLALARAARQPSSVAVLFFDLDRFKLVNDTLGHAAGDRLLVAITHRFAGLLRPADTLGRLGGDEFVVVCEDLAGETDALAVAGRLATAFDAPFPFPAEDVAAGASIGVAVAGPDVREPATLLAEADAAMYRAKQTRSAAPVLFEERMRLTGKPSSGPDTAPAREPSEPLGGHLDLLIARLAGLLEEDPDPPG